MVEAAKVTRKATRATAKAKASSKQVIEASVKPKAAAKPTHPSTSEMVNAAVVILKDRKGVSLQAIKKYIAGNYVVDVERLSPFIRKYIKSAVEKNIFVQTTGTGAAGRFKLAKVEKKSAKPTSEEKANKTTTTKSVTTKKLSAEKSSKLPPKSKKSTKSPASKTKSPKPKTIRT